MNFFHLTGTDVNDDVAGTDCGKPEGSVSEDAPTCPECGGITGLLVWMPPFRIEMQFWGYKHGDIAFGAGMDLLVSERFKEQFVRQKLTGLDFLGSAEVVKVTPKRMSRNMPQYTVARVKRARAVVDEDASGVDREDGPVCEACRFGGDIKRWSGIVVDPDSWEGEDIFIARGFPGDIITSERFYDFCQRHEFTNVNLVPAETFGHDYYPWEN